VWRWHKDDGSRKVMKQGQLMRHRGVQDEEDRTESKTSQNTTCARNEEKLLSHLTRKEQDDKCDLNQFTAEPCMPNVDERQVTKMLCSMV